VRVVLVVWLAIALGSSAAWADRQLGVVVTGAGPTIQADVQDYIAEWSRAHGFKAIRAPMPDEAEIALANCLVVDDQACARSVVDARSSTDRVLYAHVDVADKATRTWSFVAYWFVRGQVAVALEKRACEQCNGDAWHAVADEMLLSLAKNAAKMGRLKVESNPSGMLAQIDGHDLGTTPVERDVIAGNHRVVLVLRGHKVASQKVTVAVDDTTAVTLDADLEAARPSKLWPTVLLGVGVAAIITGSIYVYYGELGGEQQKFIYPESTPVGIGFLAVGVGATVGGAVLLAQAISSSSSGPVAAVTPQGGYVGWWTRF
jgi:PEGA domain